MRTPVHAREGGFFPLLLKELNDFRTSQMPRPVGELIQIGIFLQQWSLTSDFTEADRAQKEGTTLTRSPARKNLFNEINASDKQNLYPIGLARRPYYTLLLLCRAENPLCSTNNTTAALSSCDDSCGEWFNRVSMIFR